MFRSVASLFLIVLFLPSLAASELRLMMAEEPGCMWCARWNAEIAPIYPKTREGVAAPLRRVNLRDPLPEDITLVRSINFTPTFVLLVDGFEKARIEGYPGEDFFWGLLGEMLARNDITLETTP